MSSSSVSRSGGWPVAPGAPSGARVGPDRGHRITPPGPTKAVLRALGCVLAGILFVVLARGASSARAPRPRGALQGDGLSGPMTLAKGVLASRAIEGVVKESVATGAYLYVRVVDGRGRSTWVVGLGLDARPGAFVSFQPLATSDGFRSPTLERRFDRLHFVAQLPDSFLPSID